MSFIADYQTQCVAIGLVGLVASLGYIAWRLSAGSSAAPAQPPLPAGTPRPASFELGKAEHERAGNAKTVKLAQVKPTQKDIPTETVREPTRNLDPASKVQRMADLGFHAGVDRTPPARPAVPESAAVPAAEATITTDLSGEAAPADRGQTAELDDILSRIDKVLAENPVLASNTMTGATDTAGNVQPDTAEFPRNETNGGQQKLF